MNKVIEEIKNNFINFKLGDHIILKDSIDHWENGVLRLLGKKDEEIIKWIQICSDLSDDVHKKYFYELSCFKKAKIMKEAWEIVFKNNNETKVKLNKIANGSCSHKANIVWQNSLANDSSHAVVGCEKCQHGWLYSLNPSSKKETLYEEDYFEGKKKGLGYGKYSDQTDWRIQKGKRLINWIEKSCTLLNIPLKNSPSLLDVGSGYGFFRFVAEEKGWKHQGLEVSKYAADYCKQRFNFKTFVGTLEEFSQENNQKFDIMTLWDVIEHVEDPIHFLKLIKSLLNEGGICVVRTPNLLSIEGYILGSDFYSLKKEHLHYFTPNSLNLFFEKAGLRSCFIKTDSHIFSGFFGGNSNFFEVIQQGSDIFAIAINNKK